MNIVESFRIAIGALFANKARAALTMLGVIIGVMAVIILISIGQGVKSDVTSQISGLGSNLLFVMPGRVGAQNQQAAGFTYKLKPEDVDILKRRMAFAQDIIGNIEAPSRVKYKNRTHQTIVLGTTESYPDVLDRPIAQGRFFTSAQLQAGRRVTVLGKTVVDDLFGGENPIGKRVTIGGQKYLVIGVMSEKGNFMGQDFDDGAYVPLTNMTSLIGSDRLSHMIIKATDEVHVKDAQEEAKRILGKKYSPDDYSVMTQGETLSILQNILSIMTLMLAGIASISLLVGGIGIMNIMLVSVTERTREIGIRKAVGARTYDIMIQFVIEAVILSMTGGAIGILIGILGSLLMRTLLPVEVTWWAVILSFGFAAVVGIFFGVYPAWKAARLDPIEALRYE